jgi:ABC-type transport system substrate-binding protein
MAAGGFAATSALLAACGGGNEKSKQQQLSGLLAVPEDTTAKARRGGSLLRMRAADVQTFDPVMLTTGFPVGASQQLLGLAETRLKPLERAYVGETVESWEWSPDRLQITFKVRPNRTHNIPPVNGRAVDAEDIQASWARFEQLGTVRGNFSNKLNPGAPIVSVTAVDKTTVVMKLGFETATLFGLLFTTGGSWLLAPKEAGKDYDPRVTHIGWGPFTVAEHEPSVSLTEARHPGYYDADKIYVDKIVDTVIPEYAAGLAQFRAGRLHTFDVRQEEVLATKKDLPELQMYVMDPVSWHGIVRYGWNPARNTPFRDQRLRQAYAMAVDNDLLLDTFSNVQDYASQGIPLKVFRYGTLPAWVGGVFNGDDWLDPRDAGKFGPEAKYYKHDPAEAKKLIAASGSPNGIDTVAHFGGPDYAVGQYSFFAQASVGPLNDVGIRVRPNSLPRAEFLSNNWANSQGDFDGVLYRFRPGGGSGEPVEMMYSEFTPSSSTSYTGFFPQGSSYLQGDPKVTDLLTKARRGLMRSAGPASYRNFSAWKR